MKKFVATLALVPLAFGLAACGSSDSAASAEEGTEENPITIGVVGTDPANDKLVEVAAEQGLVVEIQELSDYNQPNPALANGDIDLNWFQHIDYLANYNVEEDGNIKVLGSTVIYPLGLYSTKHTAVADIPEGGEIAIPNDPTNSVRALLLLEAQDLIQFKTEGLLYPTAGDIDTENSKVTVTEVDAAQTALALSDVDASVINNDYLTDAGLNANDAIAKDDPSSTASAKYVNVFAANEDDLDNEAYNKVVEIFHSDAVQQAVADDTQGTAVEVEKSQEELNQILSDTQEAIENK